MAVKTSMAPYHHGDLRNALVAAALSRIETTGADAFSLREAAKDVGVSANAAYRHFADKDALLTAAAAVGFQALSEEMQRAMAAPPSARSPAEGRLRAVGRAYVAFALARPHLFQLMFTDRGAACLTVERATHGPTPGEVLAGALDEFAADGGVAPGCRGGAALQAWVVAHGFAMLALNGPFTLWDDGTREQALESALDLLIAGLRVSPPGAPSQASPEAPRASQAAATPVQGPERGESRARPLGHDHPCAAVDGADRSPESASAIDRSACPRRKEECAQ